MGHRPSLWGRRLANDGACMASWGTVVWNGLGYMPGAHAILGSNPSDPTTLNPRQPLSTFSEYLDVMVIEDILRALCHS